MIKERDEIDDIVDDDPADDVVDDKAKKGSDDGESEEDTPPKDIRGAIKHALKEHAEKDNDEDKEPVRPKEKKVATKKEVSEDEDESVELSDKKPEEKLETPPFYRTKGKALWDNLSADQRKFIVAREKEVSDGFKQSSEKVRAFDEMEQVVSPYRQQIQQYGATVPQTVERLFQWMTALSHQDLNYRTNALNALAQSFGIPLARQNAQPQIDPNDNDADPVAQNSNQPPEWFQQFATQVSSEIGGIKQQSQTQQAAAANSYLSNWSKDKPHFNEVRQMMHQLISSGIVPPKNGEVDLDTAYEKAIALHPEVSAQVQQETAEKASKEAKDKADKEAKVKAAKLLKARNAGSGIKPAAPSLNADRPSSSKPNGAGKTLSVRDSIRSAMDELRE